MSYGLSYDLTRIRHGYVSRCWTHLTFMSKPLDPQKICIYVDVLVFLLFNVYVFTRCLREYDILPWSFMPNSDLNYVCFS